MAILIPAWIDGDLQPVEKLDVHLRGLRHKAVSVFLTDGPHILLQRRALEKYHTPGLWANTCCTHPHWDEAPLTCAKRRLTEELGILAPQLTAVKEVEYRADVGNGLVEHELVTIYVGSISASTPIHPAPDEVKETRWATVPQLLKEIALEPDRFTPWLRIYMAQYCDDIFSVAPQLAQSQ